MSIERVNFMHINEHFVGATLQRQIGFKVVDGVLIPIWQDIKELEVSIQENGTASVTVPTEDDNPFALDPKLPGE